MPETALVAKRVPIDSVAFERAVRAYETGNRANAEILLKQLTLRSPGHASAHYVLGLLALESGRDELALTRFSRAAELEPQNAGFCTNQAEAARRLGQLEAAVTLFERALALDATRVEAHFNLGLAFDARGELTRARAAFAAAAELRPDQPLLLHRLAQAHFDLGELDLAEARLHDVLRLDAGDQRAHARLGSVLFHLGRHDEALSSLEQALTLAPDDAATHSSLVFQLPFHPATAPRALRERAERYAARHTVGLARIGNFRHPNSADPERKLRIGYVSADYRTHVTANVVLPLLRHHDPSAVEVYCYSSGRRTDETTAIFRELCQVWRDIGELNDTQAAELIARDRIDILVDLTMHMANGRLLLFARNPAPIQVAWFAYPGTTGLSSIDYRITDPFIDPPGEGDEHYTEASVRLPDTFWCWEPLLAESAPGPPPYARNGHVTFGCLNNFSKVNGGVLELWAQVLSAVPDSRLVLMAPVGSARQRVSERFRSLGIAPERVRFVAYAPRAEYFALYQEIDICLDTLPYNGHTTSLDAFWMGVPVLTLVGSTVVGRAGYSQAMNLGLPELVATTPEQLVQHARELAGDAARLGALRSSLRPRLMASPLMDGPRFARHFEAAYRQMWRKWCEVLA